jgi:hypothetical protein
MVFFYILVLVVVDIALIPLGFYLGWLLGKGWNKMIAERSIARGEKSSPFLDDGPRLWLTAR